MAGSRYFRAWPNRFTGAALTIPTDGGHAFLTGTNNTSGGGFGMSGGSATNATVPYTLTAAARQETATSGSLTAGHYVVFGKTINVSNTGVINLRNAGIAAGGTVLFGAHLYFINCTINFGTPALPIVADTAFVAGLYDGGIAEYIAEANGFLGAARIGATGTSGSSNTMNYINCSVNIYYNGVAGTPAAAAQVYLSCTDLIHTNVSVIGSTSNASAVPGGIAFYSGGCTYASTLDCSSFRGIGSAQYSASNTSPVQFSPTAYNSLTASPGLVTGIVPLTLNNAGFKPQAFFGATASGGPTFGGAVAVNIAAIQGASQNTIAPSGTVVAAGTGITGSPIFTMADDQGSVFMTTVSLDPVSVLQQNMATGANIGTGVGAFAAVRTNGAATADVIIESQTYAPQFYYSPTDNATAPTTGVGNVQIRATYNFRYAAPAGNASAQSQILNTAPLLGTLSYLSGSNGRLSTASNTDPFSGGASTTLDANGLRVPYIFYRQNSGQTTGQAASVNWATTTLSNPISARHAGTFVNNANISYDVTVNRDNAILNTTGLPFVRGVLSPWRDSAQGYVGPYVGPSASSFLSASVTSNAAIDTYFTGITAANFNTQNFGDFVAYRYSVFDTNTSPVNYDATNLNLGAQNVIIDSAGTTGFATASQVWTVRANALGLNTANNNASTGGIATTGGVVINSVFSTLGNYAPIQAGSISYAAGATVLGTINATTTLVLPTAGTVINTTGTITAPATTSTVSNNATYTGGFTFANALTLSPSVNSITVLGNNRFSGTFSVTGASANIMQFGSSAGFADSARTTFNGNIAITGTGIITFSSAVLNGVGTNSISGGTITFGSGQDTLFANRVTVASNLTLNASTALGILNMNGVSVGGSLIANNTGGSVVLAATAMNATTGTNSVTANGSAAINNSSIGTRALSVTGIAAGVASFAGSIGSGAITIVGAGTTSISGGSNLSGTVSTPSTTVTVLNATVGTITATSATTVNLGDSTGNAVFNTSAGQYSIRSTTKTTTYTIGGLTLGGGADLTISPNTTVLNTMLPTATLGANSVITFDCTTNTNLVVDCRNITFVDFVTSTFVNANPLAGNIDLLNWPSGKTIPNGFAANVVTTMTLSFTDTPATAPTIRTGELYRSGALVTLPTPTYANGAYTWVFVGGSNANYDGGIFFVDGYSPARVTQSATLGNSTVSGTAVPESNVDFGQTLNPTVDIPFIATTAWSTTNAFLASPYMGFTTTSPTYQTTPAAGRTAVELAKLVWRRTYETSNASTVEYRKALATGTIATNWQVFNTNGVQIRQVIGLATTGLGLKMAKATGSNTVIITFSIWGVDGNGDYYTLNTANGRAASTADTLILFEGFSPGASANLTTSQINAISAGVLIALNSVFNALGQLVAKASKLIPGRWTNL